MVASYQLPLRRGVCCYPPKLLCALQHVFCLLVQLFLSYNPLPSRARNPANIDKMIIATLAQSAQKLWSLARAAESAGTFSKVRGQTSPGSINNLILLSSLPSSSMEAASHSPVRAISGFHASVPPSS